MRISNKRLKKTCDDLWKEIIKINNNYCCVICKSIKYPNAHHLISRKILQYRWDINNGILLCPNHHKFSPIISAHTAPWAFEEFLKEHKKELYERFVDNRNKITNEKINLKQIYINLEKKYKDITGNLYNAKMFSVISSEL